MSLKGRRRRGILLAVAVLAIAAICLISSDDVDPIGIAESILINEDYVVDKTFVEGELASKKITIEDKVIVYKFNRHSHKETLDVFKRIAGEKYSRLTEDGIKRMRSIDFTSHSFKDVHVSHLRNASNIQTVNLNNTHITNIGLVGLSEIKTLETLNLVNCDITDDALLVLSEYPNLKNLCLSGTKVTREGVRQFKEENPEVKVSY